MAEKKIIEIDVKTGNAEKNTKNLSNNIRISISGNLFKKKT